MIKFQEIRERLINDGFIQEKADDISFQSASTEPPTIVNASYTNKKLSVSTTNSRISDFSPSGLRFYILGRGTQNVVEYHLSTAWDIATATYVRELDISSEIGSAVQGSFAAHGLFIRKDDGEKMWIFNRTEIWEYTLSTAWDITTATQTGYKDLSDVVVRGHDIDFKPDGSVLYVDDRIHESVFQFNLITSWDVETADLDYVYDTSVEQEAVRGIQLNPEGERMFLMDTGRQEVLEYYLSTPYDLRTATFVGSFSVSSQAPSPEGLTFKSDFRAFYVTSTSENIVYQYELPSPVVISYKSGWNLAGIPVETSGFVYDQLFENITQEPYIFESNGYSFSSTMNTATGYWAHLSTDETVDFAGLILQNVNLNLNEGWNLVSGLGESVSVNTVSDPQNIINSDWFGFDGAYSSAATIEPGMGYWVRASEAGTITIDHQAGKLIADSHPYTFNAEEQFNALVFTSDRDTLQTLYFGNTLPETMERDLFVMPPLPPTDAFDARFAGEESRLTESFNPGVNIQTGNKEIAVHLQAAGNLSAESWELVQHADDEVIGRSTVRNGDQILLRSADVNRLELVPAGQQVAEQPDIPGSFELHQNYPNPFNPTTTIRFSLPQQSRVEIAVYNTVGQQVGRVVDRVMEAGNHTATFDASSLTSGVYFYEMRAGSFREVRKLTVIK